MAVINIIIAIIAVGLSGLLGYWLQDRDDPISNYRAVIVNPRVKPGETLRVRHSFLRERQCHVTLEQFVYDGDQTRYLAPDETYTTSPGMLGQDEFQTRVVIPEDATMGKARYRAVRAYTCNPVQAALNWPIMRVFPDLPFEIVPP